LTGSGVGLAAGHQVTRSPAARHSSSANSLSRYVAKSGSQTKLDAEEQSADITGSKFDLVSNQQFAFLLAVKHAENCASE